MTDRNWEAELAKIDKQLASVSDEQLLAKPVATGKALPPAKSSPAAANTPAARTVSAPATVKAAGTWRGWVKVLIAVAAAAGLMFWPFAGHCGWPLLGFTAATGAVALLGVWSAVGTWRHRLGVAHFASLLVILWGVLLGAREVLPRVGYAIPTPLRGAQWQCEIGSSSPLAPSAAPGTVPPANPAASTPRA